MSLVHRHHVEHAPLGWTSSINLFSLLFALLLALAFVVLLMLFIEVMQKERKPKPMPAEPAHAILRVAERRGA